MRNFDNLHLLYTCLTLHHCRTLVFAATDTTSSALVRIFHLLAQHPDVQNRIRDEIREARDRDGDLNYKQLDGLRYLDAVIRETLRL